MPLANSSQPGSRLYYLDNIRSLVIIFVVLFHGVLPYSGACPWWYVVDSTSIPGALHFILFFDVVLMPMLFFISGLLTWPSWRRNGPRRFLAGKVRRLLVPYLLCTFLFSPIMPFIRQRLRAIDSGGEPLGFPAFWLAYIRSGTELRISQSLHSTDLVVSQYWFLLLLFLFFLGFFLCRLPFDRRTDTGCDAGMAEQPSRTALLLWITGFGLFVGLAYALACKALGGSAWYTMGSLAQIQPMRMPIYLGFFLAGIFVERRGWLPRLLDPGSPVIRLGALVLATTIYFIAVLETIFAEHPLSAVVFSSRLLRVVLVLAVTLWALPFFHGRLNRTTQLWREMADNSYEIYLIHLVPQVALQWMVLSWQVPGLVKYIAVCLLTLIVSWLISRFLVRKSTVATILAMVLLFTAMGVVFS